MPTYRAAIRVQPGARTDHVGGATPSGRPGQPPALTVRVRARAVEGAATAAAETVLAAALELRPRQVAVIRGATSRDKLVEITDAPVDIEQRWTVLLSRGATPPGPAGAG